MVAAPCKGARRGICKGRWRRSRLQAEYKILFKKSTLRMLYEDGRGVCETWKTHTICLGEKHRTEMLLVYKSAPQSMFNEQSLTCLTFFPIVLDAVLIRRNCTKRVQQVNMPAFRNRDAFSYFIFQFQGPWQTQGAPSGPLGCRVPLTGCMLG